MNTNIHTTPTGLRIGCMYQTPVRPYHDTDALKLQRALNAPDCHTEMAARLVQAEPLLAARSLSYTTKYYLWNKLTQRWGSAAQFTTGTAGNRYAALGSTAAARFNTTINTTSIVDLDVRVKLAATDWTPGVSAALMGADDGDPNRMFSFDLLTDGTLRLTWYSSGTLASALSATSTAATGAGNGLPKVVRVTLDVDNGAAAYVVKFYTSAVNGAWVQLGATITGGAVTNLTGSAVNNLGVGATGTALGVPGVYYWAELRDAIDSVGVSALWDASDYDGADGTSTGVAGETWTPTGSPLTTGAMGLRLLNASQSGQTSIGWDTSPAFERGHPVPPTVHIVNLGHNDGAAVDITAYTALVDDLVTRWPSATRVLVRQNDQPPTALNPTQHAIRQELIRALAISRRYELLDADAALRADVDWTTNLMTDWAGGDVHPNAAGGTWLAAAFDARFAAPRTYPP